MNKLVIDLRVLTPAFVRGADPARPELRAPSFKGQLRWWYRAWNPLAWKPGQAWSEGRVFGGTRQGEGQCPFTLRLREVPRFEPVSWRAFSASAPRGNRRGPGGLRYLGFSLGMRQHGVAVDHRAVPAGVRFKAVHLFRAEPGREQARGLLAAWWLLAHLGGIGARSRRGFGSLAIEGWEWSGHDELLAELPLPFQATRAEDWARALVDGLDVLERWAPKRGGWPAMAPNLGPGTEVAIDGRGWRSIEEALEDAGRRFATWRMGHRAPPNRIEDRVTIGLPLVTGRGPRRRSWRPAAFRTERVKSDRHASPLHLHVGAWRGGLGVTWSLLAGPRPGLERYRVHELEGNRTYREVASDILPGFVSGVAGPRWSAGTRSITWLHLDVLGRLAPPPSSSARVREVRYSGLEGPAIGLPVDTRAVDWTAVRDTVSRMVGQAREAEEILVSGKAPLPVFAWLGFQLQPWAGERQVVANQRKNKRWDVIDLSVAARGAFFDAVEGLDGSEAPGWVAIFVSVMGAPPDVQGLRAYFDAAGLPWAGLVTVRTREPALLDAESGPDAAQQLADIVSQVPGAFPKQQGVVLFVAGPVSLGFMAGRAVNPNMFTGLHLPNFAGGAYLPAIRYIGPARWRWDFFLAHAGPDAPIAERLHDLLAGWGRRVFLDNRTLRPGDDWDLALRQAQRDSRVTVVLVSARTDQAYYQREEIAAAIDLARRHGRRVVPVYLPGSDRDAVPYGLRLKHGLTVEDAGDLQPVAERLHSLLDDLGDEA